jgi:diguanylate cyclase (GGDEF)-like protein
VTSQPEPPLSDDLLVPDGDAAIATDGGASAREVLAHAMRALRWAAADRAAAAVERASAAAQREEAARDVAEAHRVRAETARRIQLIATDELTGTWTRRFGLTELEHEVERANRTGGGLVIAFVDVDRLKAINDSRGHLAGDALLERLGAALRASFRPYDVIVRYGGDEFLCAFPGLSPPEVSARLRLIASALRTADPAYAFTFGLAEAEPPETVRDLIGRADAALLDARRGRGAIRTSWVHAGAEPAEALRPD